VIVVDTWLDYNEFKNGTLSAHQQQRKCLQKEFDSILAEENLLTTATTIGEGANATTEVVPKWDILPRGIHQGRGKWMRTCWSPHPLDSSEETEECALRKDII
jgi:hypothetical protein